MLTPAEHAAPSPATAAPPEDLGSAPPAERVTPLEIDCLLSRAYNEFHALRLVSYTGWQADLGDKDVAQIQDLIRDLAYALVALDTGAEGAPRLERTE